jgi:hypothetical protein
MLKTTTLVKIPDGADLCAVADKLFLARVDTRVYFLSPDSHAVLEET